MCEQELSQAASSRHASRPFTASVALPALAVLAVVALVGSGRAARAATVAGADGGIHFVSQDADGAPSDVRGGEIGYELIVDPDTGAKTVGAARYAPLEIDVAMDAGVPLIAGWLDDFLAGREPVRDFVVEQGGTARRHRGGYVSAMRIVRDAEKGEAAFSLQLTLGFEDSDEMATDRSAAVESGDGEEAEAAKLWNSSAFRFELGDLPCDGVSRIDSFTIAQSVELGLEIPNLKVTFSTADADAWIDWFEDFAVKGNASDADELDGRIAFLGPDHAEVLGIELHQVGILSIAPAVGDDGSPSPDALVAEIYVEQMAVAIEELTLAHEGFATR